MIRGYRFPVLLSAALAGLAGCGGAEPPVKAPAPPPPPVERLSKKLEASLAALALPDDLVLAARWRTPSTLLGTLAEWSGAPLDAAALLQTFLGEPSRPLDLGAPIELLAVLDREREPPSLAWVVSVGLGPGPSSPASLAGPRDVTSRSGFACAESKSLGPASERLVCAGSDDHLARLLPHATRALPLAPIGNADIALSLRGSPIASLDEPARRALASALLARWDIGHINDRFDAQWAGIVGAVADELARAALELDGASLELSLRPSEQALDVSLLAPMAAGGSVLGQLLVGSGAAGLAPEEFWQAREQSEGAGFSWAFQPAPLSRMREPLAAMLTTLLAYRGVPRRLAQQARDLVAYLPIPRGPLIFSSGRLPAESASPRRAPWLDALGWQLYSVRGSFDEYRYYVDSLVKAFNDPILGPQFARLIRSGFGPQWAPVRMQQRRPLFGDLPRGAFVWEVTFASSEPSAAAPGEAEAEAPGSAPPPAQWFGILVPDEDGVRIALGADERHLSSLLGRAGRRAGAGTLAGRAGLGSLHEHRILAGGFSTVAGLAAAGVFDGPWLGSESGERVAGTPHAGASPIVYSLSQPSEAWLHLTARVSRDSLADLLSLLGPRRSAP